MADPRKFKRIKDEDVRARKKVDSKKIEKWVKEYFAYLGKIVQDYPGNPEVKEKVESLLKLIYALKDFLKIKQFPAHFNGYESPFGTIKDKEFVPTIKNKEVVPTMGRLEVLVNAEIKLYKDFFNNAKYKATEAPSDSEESFEASEDDQINDAGSTTSSPRKS